MTSVQPVQPLIIPTQNGNAVATAQNGQIAVKSPTGEPQNITEEQFKQFLIENVPNVNKTPDKDTVSFKGHGDEHKISLSAEPEEKKESQAVKIGTTGGLLAGIGVMLSDAKALAKAENLKLFQAVKALPKTTTAMSLVAFGVAGAVIGGVYKHFTKKEE